MCAHKKWLTICWSITSLLGVIQGFSMTAHAETASAEKYASSGAVQNGDHFQLKSDAGGISIIDGGGNTSFYCAPHASKFTYIRNVSGLVIIRFRKVTASASALNPEEKNDGRCRAPNVVNTDVRYSVPEAEFSNWEYSSNGVTFGGLVVPFKFRLGGVNEIVSSTTIAPYVGWTFTDIAYGMTFSPIVSAGLGLVPVVDSATKLTNSKAAFSTALGFVVTSSKNESFQAGFLVGRDFLGRTDRTSDPTVDKMWVSFYLGYKI
jgi:hypothetical protein